MLRPIKSECKTVAGETVMSRKEAIFDAALGLTVAQRTAYLARVCGEDAQLRLEVENLLRAHQNSGDFLEEPALPSPDKTVLSAQVAPLTEKAGDKIGRYKLLQQIGEGGCGAVYMAEQEEPVRRRVALKVIKLGMDTKSVIARFEAERQALAMMDHPNIARVLDAGATEMGRPFFVMELVRGIKITDYCDQNKLSTSERLKLFIQVCQAIQHAHQKGIIHRDIKPSNILVTLHDGVPVPKVIDFGIAKATQGRLTDATLFTAFEQFIGTPAYMSPEQAEMSGLDIDTRCDIYALGVLLYELLTGKTPFDARELLASGLDKMRHTIREQEPERPSTRLNTMLNADLTTAANSRRTDAPKLVHLLRGDLDWIVMKALEKDRTRRYETASALAMDIGRHLDNEPVLASPPSKIYRLQKMARRNKSVFIALGGIGTALVIGLGLSLYLFVRERQARQRAVEAERVQAQMREAAERGALVGAKLTQAGLLLSREQYDEAEKLVNEAPPHPASISVYNVLGMIHARRGEYSAAIRSFSKSTELAPDNHEAYHDLAPVLAYTGDQVAFSDLRARILRQFGHTSDPTIAERMGKDCLLLTPPSGDLPAINGMVQTALKAGPQHRFWDYFQFVKGLLEYREGHFEKAVEWLEKVTPRGADPNRTVAAYMLLAMAEQQLKQTDRARASLQQGIRLAQEKVGSVRGPEWYDQMMAHVFMREARALIDISQKIPGE
ncbi:MAG TPA: protein kinase [Verrucomicrobiae bacterium]|jgi:serine/threonine protein kinase/Flp pilus assembly protein TadD|nr:protein kinase [Verrucomicrobiae bacterium]